MDKRRLGNSGLDVAPLAFGGNVFGWTADERTSFALLDAFVGAGLNLIDTADVYSTWVAGHHGGESETIIGKWLKRSGKRADVVLATKVGMTMSPTEKGLSKKYIMQAVERSLQRLNTDHIDLYFSHIDDRETPLDETLEAHTALVKAGKVRAIGASNYGADRLREALTVSREHGYASYQCLEPLYNLYDRSDYETALEPVCAEFGLGVITYFSLASGFLAGKYRSEADLAQRARGERVRKYLNDRGHKILNALDQVARDHQATPAQVALAWLMARPTITAPIASATSIAQFNELIAATTLSLDDAAIAMLDRASA